MSAIVCVRVRVSAIVYLTSCSLLASRMPDLSTAVPRRLGAWARVRDRVRVRVGVRLGLE